MMLGWISNYNKFILSLAAAFVLIFTQSDQTKDRLVFSFHMDLGTHGQVQVTLIKFHVKVYSLFWNHPHHISKNATWILCYKLFSKHTLLKYVVPSIKEVGKM